MSRRPARALIRWVLTVAALLAAGGIALALLKYIRPVVTVTEVVRAPVVQAFYATGVLSPVREYSVKTAIEGTVQKVDEGEYVDKGSRVKRGQPVARVVDPELLFLAQKAAAELEEKRARADETTSPVLQEFDVRIGATAELLEIARREQRRVTLALETKSASQADLDRSLDRVKELGGENAGLKSQRAAMVLRLKAERRTAESAAEIAQWNLEQQTLRSPIDGVVLDRPASPGTHLAVNDHVMQIADVSPVNLVMRAAVDEEDLTKVRLGQEVRMTLYSFPGEVFTGEVGKIYDKADEDRRTFEVDVALAGPNERMSAGMTGELAFVVAAREGAAVVPSQALQQGKIYTVRDGRLRAVDAAVGLKSIERVELLSGMRAGDRVVISPVGGLKEGQPVRTTYMAPTPAAELNKPKAKEIFRGGF